MNIYREALQIQDAVNLFAILARWAEIAHEIKNELGDKYDTDSFRHHPVNVMFADKIASMTGYSNDYADAYDACKSKAEEIEKAEDEQFAAMQERVKERLGVDSTRTFTGVQFNYQNRDYLARQVPKGYYVVLTRDPDDGTFVVWDKDCLNVETKLSN